MKYSTCSTPRRGPVFLQLTAIFLAFTIAPLAANAGFLDKLKNVLGGETTSSADVSASLSNDEIGAGLKEALVVGTGKVVEQLGKTNGFSSDPAVHIPLPSSLESARSLLAKVGMS